MRSLRFVRLSILFVFVNTVSVSSLQAQKEETLYYDEDWKVTKNRSKAQYRRVFTVDPDGNPVGKIKDYYITGEVQHRAGCSPGSAGQIAEAAGYDTGGVAGAWHQLR